MKDKLQEAYDKLVRLSNINWTLSNEDFMNPLKRELIAKAEAFEAAADCLFDKFRDIIVPHDSMRFIFIREHHMQEESTDELKVKTEVE